MADIGIIGGADGPTAMLIASRVPWLLIGVCVLVITAAVVAVILCKKK